MYLRDSSVNHMSKLLGIDRAALYQWICNYESLIIDGLITTEKNIQHTKNVKENAVLEYLSGNSSQVLMVNYIIKMKQELLFEVVQ